MEILLPPEIERSVLERSRKEGRSPEALVVEFLSHAFLRKAGDGDAAEPLTLADLLGPAIGCVESPGKPGNRSEGFVAGLRRKRESGHL